MRRSRQLIALLTILYVAHSGMAQVQWLSNGAGQNFLGTTTQYGTAPVSATVGPATSFSALNVMGGTLGLPNQNLFQIHSSGAGAGWARWFRGNSATLGNNDQMGRIYHSGTSTNLGFNVQATQQGGSVWLRNWRNRVNTVNGALNGNGVTDGNGLRLLDDVPFTLNGYTSNERRGYVAIGHAATMDIQGNGTAILPWSRLHLVHANNLGSTDPSGGYVPPVAWCRLLGYRPWMRNGVSISGNLDQMYVGHKYRFTGTNPQGNEIADASDAVIQWADSTGSAQATDNFRLLFTTTPVAGATTGATSQEGLELLRARPFYNAQNQYEGYVGIGDFFAAGQQPSQRFDILNGFMRHRQLPTDAEMTSATKAMVVDANGIVGWRPYGGSADCDWEVPPPVQKRMYAARTWPPVPGSLCPEEDWRIGIGTVANIQSKLKIWGRYSVGGHAGAVQAEFETSENAGGSGVSASVSHETPGTPITGDALGVLSTVNDVGYRGSAVQGNLTAIGPNTETVYGLNGRLTLNSGSSTSVAAYGTASNVIAQQSSTANNVFGMYTTVTGAGSASAVSGVSSSVALSGSGLGSSYGLDATSTWTGGSTLLWNKGAVVASKGTGTITNSLGLDASADGTDQTALTIGARGVGYGSNPNAIFAVTGVHGEVTGASLYSRGVYGYNNTATIGATDRRYGLMGEVRYANADTDSWNVSVYGEFAGNGVLHQWAGYYNGQVQVIGNMFHGSSFIFSDEQIKTNIEDLNDQADHLMNLHAHKYIFTDQARERLHLSAGEQFGFLAQEVQEAFPQLVTHTQVMAKVDSLGNELAPAMDLEAVNYTGLVPVLVSGHQQQENRLASLEGQVTQLQTQLAQAMEQMTACCAGVGIGAGQRASSSSLGSSASENDLRVVPNPVADRTELRYTLANEGRVRLEITDASSRIVLTREEGQRTAGSFMYEWDTTLLAPGTYFCTLYINEEMLVKKSVKLGVR